MKTLKRAFSGYSTASKKKNIVVFNYHSRKTTFTSQLITATVTVAFKKIPQLYFSRHNIRLINVQHL